MECQDSLLERDRGKKIIDLAKELIDVIYNKYIYEAARTQRIKKIMKDEELVNKYFVSILYFTTVPQTAIYIGKTINQ